MKKSNNPLVSIIIVVKNGEKFLQTAIESILNQSYKNYEIIVIDGNSIDKTPIIVQSYSQIRYFLQNSQGIANAYNQGIDEAKAELLTFLSCDDIWTYDKLKIQVDYMINNPKIQYVVGKVKFFLEERNLPPSGFKKELLEEDHIAKIMETLMVRKNVFEKIGKFNPEFLIAEDTDWFARCQDAKIPMKIIDKVFLYKRIHNNNASLNDPQYNQYILKILRESIHRKRKNLTDTKLCY
ncbi:glycosyltransferase [Geminocystis sp. NIES-3709]|uniref:glycosyltransferase n=1 Tax=Geminocystis sp. NIES-3709 TaxID=1617448 RepID=UPI0005FC6D75|nr:glycosyltransferase [Geminocystis sp. NIES-3709]BAQ65281.1 glycosyl transferase [Geminocystis sp. NIES-3709]